MSLSARFLGYAIIFMCPAAAGIIMGRRTEETVKRLESIILLIEHIKYEIGERMTPQNELFARFENKTLEKCGFLEVLKKCRADGERSVLETALDMYGELFPGNDRCNMLLRDFSASLGKIPHTLQTERCTNYSERFGAIYTEISKKAVSEAKLYRSMGILCGVAAVLVLL